MIWKLLVCVRTCSLFNQSPVSIPSMPILYFSIFSYLSFCPSFVSFSVFLELVLSSSITVIVHDPADPIVPICFKLSRFICNQLQIHDRARMGGDMSNLQIKKMPSDL
ncbi:hypothetical protein XELAEV_18003259mg [Xenopus laevis]|nr:hypothetical protein XELAEV_18003259mg [Xenopus laevis]